MQPSAKAGFHTENHKIEEKDTSEENRQFNRYTRPHQYGTRGILKVKFYCYNCGKIGYMECVCKVKYFDNRSNNKLSSNRKRSSSRERSQSTSSTRNRKPDTPFKGRSIERESEGENSIYATQ